METMRFYPVNGLVCLLEIKRELLFLQTVDDIVIDQAYPLANGLGAVNYSLVVR